VTARWPFRDISWARPELVCPTNRCEDLFMDCSQEQQIERLDREFCSKCAHKGVGADSEVCAVRACAEVFAEEQMLRYIVPRDADGRLTCLMFLPSRVSLGRAS